MPAELDGARPPPSQPAAEPESPADRPSDEPPADPRLEDRLLRLLSAAEAAVLREPATAVAAWGAGSLVALLGFEDERAVLSGTLYSQLFPSLTGSARRAEVSAADRERSEMTAACRAELEARSLCALATTIGVGGLLAAVARACVGHGEAAAMVGCALVLPAPRQVGTHPPASVAAQLFHEAPGRVLVAIPAARYADTMLLTTSHGVPLLPLGRTGGRELVVRASDGGSSFREVLRLSAAELFRHLRP